MAESLDNIEFYAVKDLAPVSRNMLTVYRSRIIFNMYIQLCPMYFLLFYARLI